MLLNQGKTKINFDVNGFDTFTEEKQKDIKQSTSILLGLQLRELVENSFNTFCSFFQDIPMLDKLMDTYRETIEEKKRRAEMGDQEEEEEFYEEEEAQADPI